MKRANKTGTIIHRNDKKRRRPYSVYLDGGRDPDTFRRKRIFLGSFAKHSEAQSFLEKYLHGMVQEKTKTVTLADIWKLYREDKEALTGKPLNRNYVSTYKRYIQPKLASLDISVIKTMHMQNCINTCASVVTQRFMRSIFSGIFAYAVSNDLASKDYTTALKTGTMEKSTKHRPFTTEDMRLLWENSDKDIVKVVLIQTYTGTRKSDLAGVLLQNVHLSEKYMVGGVKTEAGRNRIIPIADCILPFVRYFYVISKFAGHPCLIMPDVKRGLIRDDGVVNIDRIYRQLFPGKHSTHDARHTFITMADNYNLPESLVKKIVGHKANDITSDVYTHKSLPQLLALVNRLPHGTKMYVDPGEEREEIGVATG